nr:DNA polymerase [Spirochaetales bacterium]
VPRQSDIYKVRDVIVAPEHYALISADYSQAELRLLAHYTQDKFLIDTFKAGDDIHQATADRVGLERSEAKRINFGIVYGMGVPETALQLNISEQTAREYLDEYHKQIPGIRELYKEVEKRAMRSGYIRMWTGRRKHYDDLDETWKAMSNLIQGGVAELMRVAIMKLSHTLRGYNVRMLLQVHDDVLFEVPEIEVKDRFKLIKDTMEDFDFNVPIRVEVKAGKSWGGAVPIEKSGYLPKQRELDLGV